MTKTKTMNKPTVRWDNDLAAELVDFDRRQRACLKILADMARGEEVSPEEEHYLRFAGYSEPDIRRELGRMGRAIDYLKIAGHSQERQQAASRLAKLEDELAGTIGAMKAERDRLNNEIANAEKQLTEARADVERRNAAVEQLRNATTLPGYIIKQLDSVRKRRGESAPAKTQREAEARLQLIQGVLSLTDRDGKRRHAESLLLSKGPNLLVIKTENGVTSKQLNDGLWSEYLQQLREEIPQREAELAAASKQLKTYDDEAEAIKDFYLTQFESQEA